MAHLAARWPTLLAVLGCTVAAALTGGGPAAAATSYGVVATIPLGECSSPSGVSVDPATDDIYVAGTCYSTGISTSGEVTEIDGATNQVTASLPLGEGRSNQGTLPRVTDVAVDPATDAVYETVSNGLSQVSVVNGATNALTATIPISAGGFNLAVDPATNTVYVTTGNNAVSVINGATNQVTATIPLSAAPGAIAADPATNTVYVGTGNAVSVINGATNQVTATIPLSSAGSIAADPATNTVYVGTGNAVSVINGATNQVTATIPLSSAGSIAVDPSADTVYVSAGGTSPGVSVINGATNQVTATVPISSGYSLAGLGVDPSTHNAYLSASGTSLPPNGVVYVIGSGGGGGTGQAPAVTTTAASGVTSSGATVGGTVNPEGQAATYQFDYGTTTSYGSSVPSPAGSAGSGTSAVTESASLTGLRTGTTYHYRIEATNATGTTYGPDRTFTTPRHR
jgi:YVTN family beta-propeller protein